MNKETTTSIRGMMAILIVLSHLGEYYYKIGGAFTPWGGYIGVSIFYFFSGYNLAYCKKNKKNYIDGFLGKKFIRVFVPGYLMYILYMCVINRGFNVEIIYKCAYLKNDCFFYWYVKSIIYIYLYYFVLYKLFEKFNIDNDKLFGIILWIFSIISNSFFVPTWLDYIIPTGFILGWMVEIYGKKVNKYAKKYSIVILESGMLILFILLANIMESSFSIVIFRYLACVDVALLCFSISIRSINLKLLNELGVISYEIYLVHPVLIRLCEAMRVSKIMYVLVVIIGTLVIAYVLSEMTQYIIKKCYLTRKK